jgi:DNA-binding transcriptional LysR family regulator
VHNRRVPFRLHEMRTFLRVAHHESFALAARELGLSASAVSKQIRQLEQRLGVRLLNRTTRRVRLTEPGRVYVASAQRVLDDLEEVEATLRGLQGEPRGTLRVSAGQDFGWLYLCEILGEFAGAHPHLRIDLELTDRSVDLIDEGFDVVLRIARPTSSTLRVRRLGTCETVLCASPAYLDAYGAPASPAELAKHSCIEYAYAATGAWPFVLRGRAQAIPVSGRLRANSGWALRAFALAGQGIAWLPRCMVHEQLESGALRSVLDDALDGDLDLMALLPPGRHVAAKSRAFVDFAAEHLRAEPWLGGRSAYNGRARRAARRRQ